MKVNFLIFVITAFLVANTYYDGKFTDYIIKGKKYFRMATFAFVGLSIYLFVNKNPGETKSLVKHATELIKYMPVDNNTRDMLTPLFDFTNARDNINSVMMPQGATGAMNRMMNSGSNTKQRRVVSETKKKYVASQQEWKCKNCSQQLSYTYEIDHRVPLESGGSNHVTNLDALCVGCHKEKTLEKNLF